MKGRIIGREGRNIRSLETITGVELIIDDTPEAITISSFDPVAEEKLQDLLLKDLFRTDEFIQPELKKCLINLQERLTQSSKQEGEKAVLAANCGSVHPELIKLLRKIKIPYLLRTKRSKAQP